MSVAAVSPTELRKLAKEINRRFFNESAIVSSIHTRSGLDQYGNTITRVEVKGKLNKGTSFDSNKFIKIKEYLKSWFYSRLENNPQINFDVN